MKRPIYVLLVLALIAVGALAWRSLAEQPGVEPSPEPGTPSEPTTPVGPSDPDTIDAQVRIYMTRGEEVGVAGRTVQVTDAESIAERITGALEALLTGPTAEEEEWGLATAIPEQTELIDVSLTGGIATVNLTGAFESGGGSLSMMLRAAQVVHTVTQFEGITTVAFKLDGELAYSLGGEGIRVGPTVTRMDFEDVAPAILVESPVPGEQVKSPVSATGTANTFEAQFMVEIVDPNGLVLTEQSVMATSGTGTRGTFSTTVDFVTTRTGLGTMIFYEPSAMDGSRTKIIEIPVRLQP